MTDKIEINFRKSEYTEAVVRKSLYWASEICDWELRSEKEDWVLILHTDSGGLSNFHRILNDFILREKLDAQTKNLRIDIINAALKRLASGE